MRKARINTWVLYAIMLVVFFVASYVLIQKGEALVGTTIDKSTTDVLSSFDIFKSTLFHNIAEPLAMLLLQIISILIVSRLFGFFFAKIGQPTVIGEILAGIILGPSLLGYFFPDVFQFLFAAESLSNLYILSQLGLILFMFIVGMELDLGTLKSKISETFVISHASIFLPYFLGMLLAYFVYEEFAATYTDFLSFALFIGISMSITAFPVLARIVQERGLNKTHLGGMAIASAANDDITAWCILSGVIAVVKTGGFASSLYTILFSVIYVLFMLYAVKPFLKKIGEIYSNTEVINKGIVVFLLLVLIISSFITDLIGIHALFGAFLAGVVMPPLPNFRKLIIEKIEDVSVTLLLPLFFVYTGLRTEIGLLNTPYLWTICFLFILVAVTGKFIGGAFTARAVGESWKDSLSIGILMNTRGLMELIVLNIGFEMGILPPPIFVMLVIMALVTTFMTSPVLSLINVIFPQRELVREIIKLKQEGVFKVLISVGNPVNGKVLLKVAKSVLDGAKNSLSVHVLHLTQGTDTNPIYGDQYASEGFKGVTEEAKLLEIPIATEYKVADKIENEIVKSTNTQGYDFLLVGAGLSMAEKPLFQKSKLFANTKWLNDLTNSVFKKQLIFYPGALIKDKTRYFIDNSNCSVGVFVNRNFTDISSTIILLNDEADVFLLRYAKRLLKNNPLVEIDILDVAKLIANNELISKAVSELKNEFPVAVKIIKRPKNYSTVLKKYSFMLISYNSWNVLSVSKEVSLENIPSTLIINKKVSRFSAFNMTDNNYVENNFEDKYKETILDPFSENM